MIYVKPAPGMKIRNPQRGFQHLDEAGDHVPETDSYWQKLLREGDVVRADPPKPAPAAKAKS